MALDLGHRWGGRVRLDLPVVVLEERRDPVGGYLNDVSLSGALLRTERALHLYASIGIRIELPSFTKDACVLKARVSRTHGDGIGIEWCEFAPDVVKDLLRLPSGGYPL